MRKGNVIVEQVDFEGNICQDYDTSLSTAEIYEKIKLYFPKVYKDSEGMICGEHKRKKYSIRVKNITYLGIPHSHYKKRIQIPDDLKAFYQKSLAKGMQPLLLGIYTYGENLLFGEFAIDDFINKKAHNSSAHVYTSDLSDATVERYFQKEDYFGNRITVFKSDVVDSVLDELLGITTEDENDVIFHNITKIGTTYAKSTSLPRITEEKIEQFFAREEKEWNGIECYEKMIRDNYRNKFQLEWAGFFLEYEFEKYIHQEKITSYVRYEQNKSEGGIDLDLYFPDIDCYGDLKAHSETSRGIQGNDWNTVFDILNSTDRPNHIFYIVCEHSTIKDSEKNFEVTKFWNRAQHKKDEMSYSKRMKNSVVLRRWMILDINPGNKEYLTMFKQGINSDGKPRNPKIMIEQSNLDKFIIAEGRI